MKPNHLDGFSIFCFLLIITLQTVTQKSCRDLATSVFYANDLCDADIHELFFPISRAHKLSREAELCSTLESKHMYRFYMHNTQVPTHAAMTVAE
jgi:hypothetical protein